MEKKLKLNFKCHNDEKRRNNSEDNIIYKTKGTTVAIKLTIIGSSKEKTMLQVQHSK